MSLGQLLLDFAVVVDASFLRVNQKNLSRLQPSLAHHIARLKVHHAHLRGHHHHALAGNGVARGAQAVPVEHTAGIAPVAEEQGSRAVPRLHQDGVVFVEGLQVFINRIQVVERLRHQYGHGLWQAESAHGEKLKDVVERGRIAHARLYDGGNVRGKW